MQTSMHLRFAPNDSLELLLSPPVLAVHASQCRVQIFVRPVDVDEALLLSRGKSSRRQQVSNSVQV
jgi:hypothetical protein